MAKELCMVENNELGRMFRKYFIEVEKRYRKIQTPKLPRNYLEALKELVRVEEERQALEAENKKIRPKAEAFDELISTEGNYTMSEVAKILKKGRNRIFKFLRIQGILRKNNEPYQEYVDRGYFKLRTYTIKHSNYEEVKVQTLVTRKVLSGSEKY
ncbi:phage antirepressor KilAC domain-containing protein [Marinitoga lauensis]|uniref:phage antirepressor KilAC domain-containing protein n=1 Tax=Marinitoga lauensis TaxID=2201189 RepID=UPI0019815521|nr:phage antirepressor KilAC domain-containing protein [Marinitoga lauensis]